MTGAVNRMRSAIADVVVPTRALTVTVTRPDGQLPPAERITLTAATPNGPVRLSLLEGAHDQMATALKIERRFYDRMLSDHPDLLAHTMQALMHREPQRKMLRMLKPTLSAEMAETLGRTETQYAVRAVVSDVFRPLDNAGVIDHILPAARKHNLELAEWNLDDRKFTVRFVGPNRTVGEIREAHGFAADATTFLDQRGQSRSLVSEVLSFGVSVTNSETGHGALAVNEFSQVLRCLNGYAKNDVHRTRHVGRRPDEEFEGLIGVDTRRLELAHIYTMVRDRFTHAVGAQKQALLANTFATAMGSPLTLPEGVPFLEFVDLIGERFELSEEERTILGEEVVHEMLESGQRTPTRFTLAQGMTAAAKRVPRFERKTEIESIGWRIIEDPTSALIKAAGKAARAPRSTTRPAARRTR